MPTQQETQAEIREHVAEQLAWRFAERNDTGPEYAGRGCLKVIRNERNEQGAEVKVVELVYGWRLIALVDLVTLIPLALRIVQIQDNEVPYLLGLIQQAQMNLAPQPHCAPGGRPGLY